MSARFLLCPGRMQSRTDGDRHYIKANQLAALYGIPMTDCIVLPDPEAGNAERRASLIRRCEADGDLTALGPRYDGDYSPPEI